MDSKVIIGIPVFNDCEYFKEAVRSLFNSTDFPFKLIIVESESTDGSAEYADTLAKALPDIVEVFHTKREGPIKAYNLLFQIAKERQCDLYLTQTDVIHFRLFKRDWLAEANYISKQEGVGILAPFGAWGNADSIAPGIPWAGGWACYIPIKTINLLGGYDERYEIGDLVDTDYSYNVVKQGLKLVQLNYWVQHHWLTAHVNEQRDNLEEIKQRNRERFKSKYGLD